MTSSILRILRRSDALCPDEAAGKSIHSPEEVPVPNISYPAVEGLEPQDRDLLEHARWNGTPRPESQSIRSHVPAVLHAFTNAWRETFIEGVLDHSVKELCRVYVSQSIDCDY